MISDTDNPMPIGWSVEPDYPTVESKILPGDRIVLYTDGAIEARNSEGSMFGEERFHELIRSFPMGDPPGLADRVIEKVRGWTSGKPDGGLGDDVTLIILDFTGNSIKNS